MTDRGAEAPARSSVPAEVEGGGLLERHLRVPRSARVYQIGEPGRSTTEIWVACHGYGQLAAPFARALEPLRDPARVVAVPEGLSRFYLGEPGKRHGPDSPVGATWMTREDREREIADYVEYLDLLAETLHAEVGGGVSVTALGFSQGVATVCRWAALGAATLHRLVLWGGPLPNDLPFDRGAALFGGASVVIVGGRTDRVVPPAALEQDQRRLAGHGITADLVLHDGGHALNSALLERLATRQ